MASIKLNKIAYARSGDKGSNTNIGVIAYTEKGYEYLKENLTADLVQNYFKQLRPQSTVRYELPNLIALNFVLNGVLGGGGSCSLRIDSQGKALGQALLQMPIVIEDDALSTMLQTPVELR